MSDDVHSLADLIREGEFSFDFLEEMDIYINFPKIVMAAVLSHPDCTTEFFMKKYPTYKVGVGTTGDTIVLPRAKVLENIEVIAHIVKAEENTIKSILEKYEFMKGTFSQIGLNPHTPIELKTALYEKTGNEKFIPDSAKDLFIF